MRQTVVGAFDQYSAAQRAADYLASHGIERDHIHVQTDAEAESGYRASSTPEETHGSKGVMASVRSFFSEVFGPDREHEDLHQYAETIKRGGAVVAVDVDEETQVNEVCRQLKDAGAIDLDQRVSEWRATGWRGFDEDVSTGTATAGTLRSDADLAAGRTLPEQENVVPVVQEEIEIGKREVEQGGVRVYTRTVEQPVHESVDLRSERVVVERRPVDRPVTEADVDAMRDRTIEMRETAEKAVVSKTAHVVEEVVVGKEVEHRTQQIDDTVRHTEVEIERLGDEELASGYRTHWNQNYASLGGRYEDYDPAYRYGYSLASDTRYRGQDWDAIEPTVRRDWESRYPGSTWDRMKSAVRHAWERGTGGGFDRSYDTSGTDLYRTHWNENYASMGGRYEDYDPAYRYGQTLASDARYRGLSWDAMEPSVRRDWETRYPGSTWDRMKAAVRHAWERAKT